MHGFLLGLSTGTFCVAYCAPMLVPYLLGEGGNVRDNVALLARFLAGRLLGYLAFALLAWIAGAVILQDAVYRARILGLAYIILAALLLVMAGLGHANDHGAVHLAPQAVGCVAQRWPMLFPIVLGILTGINLCPPFLLVLTEAVGAGSLAGSLWFFFTFFLGTSLYFLPMSLLGCFKRFTSLQTIGKITTVIIALYYFYRGGLMAGGY
ncbi:MAG: sulfite exporter TauE/SafE family protein [Candidatus Vecturithrix sp.]|nr:sulfite exporter TauE/SafE family protein [Candidatus Vecturithrix sp.]